MVIKNKELRYGINTAKEGADLHSNVFSQYILLDYLSNYDIEKHIEKIRLLYKAQCQAMIGAMEQYFPKSVTFTRPEGGMFIWATLPQGQSALELFHKAKTDNLVFVPGNPFYVDGRNANTLRLNYTNCDEIIIVEGIKRLGRILSGEVS